MERLGALLTSYIAQDFEVLVFDPKACKSKIKELNAVSATLKETAACPLVIPAVPMSNFEEVLYEIKDHLSPHSTVMDVCSVKEIPVRLMEEILPENINILGTHPMFGPDSAKDTLFGTRVVFCKSRINEKRYKDIKHYMENHGITIVEVTPKQHDEQISHSLLLTHFIGRALMDIGAKRMPVETKGYRRLMKILETVQNDSYQLFEDMNRMNSFSTDMRKSFIESLEKISKRLG